MAENSPNARAAGTKVARMLLEDQQMAEDIYNGWNQHANWDPDECTRVKTLQDFSILV